MINIIDVKYPDKFAVRKGNPGQSLIVIFKVDNLKFRMVYLQEHCFYRGMPGIQREYLTFSTMKQGEIISSIDCSGEFVIPHDNKDMEPYNSHCYMGDDRRFLNPTNEEILDYLIKPFVNRYV